VGGQTLAGNNGRAQQISSQKTQLSKCLHEQSKSAVENSGSKVCFEPMAYHRFGFFWPREQSGRRKNSDKLITPADHFIAGDFVGDARNQACKCRAHRNFWDELKDANENFGYILSHKFTEKKPARAAAGIDRI
jgi:hypothetical protein